MHEMSLCESILTSLEASAKEHQFERVKRVVLEIGKLSTVEVEAMRFAFDAVTRNSLADGATLDIVDVPGQAWCFGCNAQVDVEQRYDACPYCGSYQLQVTGGEELKIKELEVD